MHLIPTQDEVVALLRETGALRDGHFEYPTGLHSNEYLQVPLALRHYQHQRLLSVGLSRLLRRNPEIRAIVPDFPSSCPPPAVCPWHSASANPSAPSRCTGRSAMHDDEPMRFRQYVQPEAGRTGRDRGRYPAHRKQARRN